MREVDEDPLCQYAFAPEDFISRSIACVLINVNFPARESELFFVEIMRLGIGDTLRDTRSADGVSTPPV